MTESRSQSPAADFIMLSEGSFVFFSVNGGKTEIRPPLDTLDINIPLNLNVNITANQVASAATLASLAVVALTGIPRSALAKELDISQQPQIAYVSETGLPWKPQNSAPTFSWPQNGSISNLAAVDKVDSNSTYSSAEKTSLSTYSSAEETSLNVVNPKSKKSNTFNENNKNFLVKSNLKNHEKSNFIKNLLKHLKIIVVGNIEFTKSPLAMIAINQPVNQPVAPDVLESKRLAEEITILTDVNHECTHALLEKSFLELEDLKSDLKLVSDNMDEVSTVFKHDADFVMKNTYTTLNKIKQNSQTNLQTKFTETRNAAVSLAKTYETTCTSGYKFYTQSKSNLDILKDQATRGQLFLNIISNVVAPLTDLINSRVNHAFNNTISKHENFGETVLSVHDLAKYKVDDNFVDPFPVVYNLFKPVDFFNNENRIIRYHDGIFPQQVFVGVIAGENNEQTNHLADKLSKLPGELIHLALQKALVLQGINEIVPGSQPQEITLKLPNNSLENSSQEQTFPVQVWSETSNVRASRTDLDNIQPIATLIMDQVDINLDVPAPVTDNNVNNLALKGNLLVAARLKVATEIPHFSALAQADLFNLNQYRAPLKDRLFIGGTVDLLGAIGAKNYQPFLIEVSAQKSVLSPGYRISLNVGLELGF